MVKQLKNNNLNITTHFLLHINTYSFICSLILLLAMYSINFCYCYTEDEFVPLIKKMAIKNHNDPSLFKKALEHAVTPNERLKAILTDKYYECIYANQNIIYTKADANKICGHFIKF